MLKQSVRLTVVGFILVFFGAFSLLLNTVGVDLVFLQWLYDLGAFASIGIRIIMIVIGFSMIFIGQTDWSKEEI